jgi:hypothetical protein
MDVIECVSAANLGLIQNYITTYTNHSAAAKYGGKPLLSSFAGQNCRFGQSTMTAGWTLAMAGLRNSVSPVADTTFDDADRCIVCLQDLLHSSLD